MPAVSAGIAQLVEHDLAKVGVAGSSPVSRSSPRGPRVVALLALLLSLAASRADAQLALAPGDPAPTLAAVTIEGEAFRADWTASALTVVNFWATWCEPCREEMPALQKLSEAHASEGLSVVGVMLDRDAT